MANDYITDADTEALTLWFHAGLGAVSWKPLIH